MFDYFYHTGWCWLVSQLWMIEVISHKANTIAVNGSPGELLTTEYIRRGAGLPLNLVRHSLLTWRAYWIWVVIIAEAVIYEKYMKQDRWILFIQKSYRLELFLKHVKTNSVGLFPPNKCSLSAYDVISCKPFRVTSPLWGESTGGFPLQKTDGCCFVYDVGLTKCSANSWYACSLILHGIYCDVNVIFNIETVRISSSILNNVLHTM